MRRKVFLLSAGAAVVALLLFALGSQTPAAQADESSVSWDVAMDDPPTGIGACTNSNDDSIDTGECPDVDSSMWFQTAQTAVSDEPSVDLANIIWEVDGYTTSTSEDLDGDTSADPGHVIPANGLRATPGELINHGATVGTIDFKIQSNIIPTNVVYAKNIDDVAGDSDDTVRGQPAVCDVAEPRAVMTDSFDVWNSSRGPFVVSNDETQSDNYGQGEDCSQPGGTPNDMYDGIDCMPEGVIAMLNASGLGPYLQGRGFGLADIEVSPIITIPIDINFLSFNLLGESEVQGYMTNTLILYPHMPSPDPSDPGYDSLAQTILTCPPFNAAPAHMYGITQNSDFDGDTTPEALGGEIHRQIVGTGGPYDYYINKSTQEDYDGDTIADIYDRCDTDPATGSATDDDDGDTLTGTCDVLEDSACPGDQSQGCAGNVQEGGAWNTTPPWDPGQDADGDTQVNYADNCPTVANGAGDPSPQMDTDHDGVGDRCDPAPYIAGAGDGYASPAPGTYLEHDNLCIDQFSIGAAEPRGEVGAVPGKYCYVNEATFPTADQVDIIDGQIDVDEDGDVDADDDLSNVLLALAAGGTDQVDVIDGQIDVDEDGDVDADDDLANVALDLAAGGTDEVDIIDGQIDVDEDGDVDADDDLTDVLLGQPYINPPLASLGITYDDSNDDGDPDWADVDGSTAYSAGDNIDTDDNTDNPAEAPEPDWDSDACEAVSGTDPLDPTSKSLGFLPIMDCDGDWFSDEEEEAAGTDPFNAASNPGGRGCVFAGDADCDGCPDASEPGLTPPAISSDPWDWYDVPVTALGTIGSGGADISSGDPAGTDDRDGAVNIINDVLSVLEYSGTSYGGPPNAIPRDYDDDVNGDTVPDGRAYDRSVGATRTGAPDGAVTIIVDVLAVLAQSGQSC